VAFATPGLDEMKATGMVAKTAMHYQHPELEVVRAALDYPKEYSCR
jgi:hypothetical protein